jgi:ABC-2 type transport system ATP-binding protein
VFALEIRGLRKSYGPIEALASIDLDVRPGEVLALLGMNGAGKTTLASIVMGLVRADAGTISVFGRNATRDRTFVRSVIGFVPQETGVYPTLTVRQNIEFFGRIIGLRRRQLSAETDELLHALDLSHLADRSARQLSTGEKRRVHTAVALIGGPRLLFLDEPTVGSDMQTRQRLMEIVRSRAGEGVAIVYTTHYLREVEQLAATVAILHRGQIIARGTCDELVREHGRTELRLTFEGTAPLITGPQGEPTMVNGSVLTIVSETPWETLGAALSDLKGSLDRIRSLEVVRAELESVFLDLTRVEGDAARDDAWDARAVEDTGVAAS